MQKIEWTWIFKPEVDDQEDIDRNVISFKTEEISLLPGFNVAIVVHGAACTHSFMRRLTDNIASVKKGKKPIYDAIYTLAYDWRDSVEENAIKLLNIADTLTDAVTRVDLHGYSLGGVVSRLANQMAPDYVPKAIRHVFTYNSPMTGTPLAHLSAIGKISGYCIPGMRSWNAPGVRDLIPNSAILNKLKASEMKNETYFAGSGGSGFLAGITQKLFMGQSNDGIASVDSQVAGLGKAIVTPYDHFGVLFGHGAEEIGPAILETWKKEKPRWYSDKKNIGNSRAKNS